MCITTYQSNAMQQCTWLEIGSLIWHGSSSGVFLSIFLSMTGTHTLYWIRWSRVGCLGQDWTCYNNSNLAWARALNVHMKKISLLFFFFLLWTYSLTHARLAGQRTAQHSRPQSLSSLCHVLLHCVWISACCCCCGCCCCYSKLRCFSDHGSSGLDSGRFHRNNKSDQVVRTVTFNCLGRADL